MSRGCLVLARNFFSSEMLKRFLRETHFRKVLHFLYFCLSLWGFDFEPASISPASVSDHGATNKNFTKLDIYRLNSLGRIFRKL